MRKPLYPNLHLDWAYIADTPAARRCLATWAEAEPALASYGSPAELVTHAGTLDEEARRPIESALLRRASDDVFAARTLLQVLLLRLNMSWVTRRHSLPGPEEARQDRAAELVSHLWEAIRAGTDHCDPGRRLVEHARGAIRSQARAERRREARFRPWTEDHEPTSALDDALTTAERLTSALTQAHRAGRLSERHARLLLGVASGLSPQEVSAAVGLERPRAVYYQLELATAELARASA